MKTCASIFSGGKGFEAGAVAAGLIPVWGVEMNPDIARVAEDNFNARVVISRAQDVDYSLLEKVDWLHASPQCINASQAKQDAGEAEEDVSQAQACVRAFTALLPSEISLENVWNYRNFESFRLILNCLQTLNYQFNFWHLNSADYGVPQTRKRLILLASRHHRPQKPARTHSNKVQGGLFEPLPKWIGWYEAIEDLIPTLPESKFAEWQLKRLPEEFDASFLMRSQNVLQEGGNQIRPLTHPAMTITANEKPRAFIAHPNADNDWFVTREGDKPCFTIKANNNGVPRAFIVPGGNEYSFRPRFADEPVQTIGDVNRVGNRPRAFIVDGKPANYAGELQIINSDEPVVPITATQPQHPFRAWLSQGRVVSMTPRALARFQTIPDWYRLPEKASLACRIIGNAVPSLLVEKFIKSELLALRRVA